ncbi:hypothetical protein MNBD_GAMMA09-2395 [hydrothermal vent metagenome]|uniref:Uncharacterized protein n=1 Tax=hydrothermal vent metagenome TaxID=652676 RepID=A0A3B0XV52_9ZZZZ
MIRLINRSFKAFIVLSIYLLSSSTTFADTEDEKLLKQIKQLETEFKTLSTEFYIQADKGNNNNLKNIDDIDQLFEETSRLTAQGKSVEAIQLLYINKNTIRDNLDHQAIFTFIALLLHNNEWNLALKLRNAIKEESDISLSATTQFIFAKYHAPRNEWAQVSKALEGTYTELSPENTVYAYLLKGSALQHLKKHRQAIKAYSKIPPDSHYYIYAQLNTAIANIRQGWWTDARTTINNLLKHTNQGNQDELTNRLYLVLGYALLQREYYRDARDTFRHIALNSRYTNRALLGIGLSATNQGDYVGGLNALSILKEKDMSDLSVEESYLLIPYVYEKLQQELTVISSYSEGMKYYQQRIKTFNKIANQHINYTEISYRKDTNDIIIQNNILDYGKHFPRSFLSNYQKLIDFSTKNNNKVLRKKVKNLMKKHDNLLQGIIGELMQERIAYLKSYLNQSRYGLARMYDHSNKDMN